MGRTVLPFSQVIRAEMERLKKFRRALRSEDQEIFDRLFDYAQMEVQTGVYASFSEPMVPILLSILLEQEKRLLALESRLRHREATTISEGSVTNTYNLNEGSCDARKKEPPGS